MTYLVGKIVLDVDAGAPNNARGKDNVGLVKSMRIGRDVHPYVSAQAFRRWLRDSLPAAEGRSPVTRSGKGRTQQAYTGGRPDRYLDDDLFGYMVAVKGGATCQRDTVFATGTLVSVSPQTPTLDFGTMSRDFDAGEDPVIHEHEHYTAELGGDVLLDLPRVGTFEVDGSGVRIPLTADAAKEVEAGGAERVQFRQYGALRLPIEERRRRVAVLLRGLSEVRGGAKRSMHYGDRAPALVLLAPLNGGVNPYTRVLVSRGGRAFVDPDVLREEMAVWADEHCGPVLLGWAPGFLGEQREQVRDALTELVHSGRLVIDHPRVVLTELASAIEDGRHDGWFEDPAG